MELAVACSLGAELAGSHLHQSFVGFKILTAAFLKSIIFWVIMPGSALKVHQHFRGTY
jgi:hypothetical protein